MVTKTRALHNGIHIPTVGLGTSRLTDPKGVLLKALSIGYQHVDTAEAYGNETQLGEALRESEVEREEVFVTTKLWREYLGYDSAHEHLDASLKKLGLSYVDLYLVHWPGPDEWTDVRIETWRAMEELYEAGKAKAIGVSNYALMHLEELEPHMKIPPMVNQIEFHPFIYQAHREIHEYCKEHGIVVTSYCPLMRGHEHHNRVLEGIAEKYEKSVAQVLLRWNIEHGNVVIPKSAKEEHLKQNINIFNFELEETDRKTLDELGENESFL